MFVQSAIITITAVVRIKLALYTNASTQSHMHTMAMVKYEIKIVCIEICTVQHPKWKCYWC